MYLQESGTIGIQCTGVEVNGTSELVCSLLLLRNTPELLTTTEEY